MSKCIKIKVLLVLPDLSVGGMSMVVIDLCNNINNQLFNVSILLLSNNIEALKIKPLKNKNDIHIVNYTFLKNYNVFNYLKHIFIFKYFNKNNKIKFVSKVLEINPDIIHFNCNPTELILGHNLKRNYANRLLYTDHSVRISNKEYSAKATLALSLIYWYLYRPFQIIAVSKAVYDNIIKFKIKNKNKITLINNNIDTEYYTPITKSENKIIKVIYISRINSLKGHDVLINAWSLVNNCDMELHIIGPDELNGKMNDLVLSLGLEKNVFFKGTVSDIKEALKYADIAVFPSYKEGLPISLLEKMAVGLPIIVSDIPELTNIISNNENGLVFRKGDSNDLAKKIELLKLNKKLRIKLGEKARETVVMDYSNKNVINKIMNIYNSMYNKK